MANAAPIADLTYRNYDGPLDAPQYRWWVIAKVGIRKAIKDKWFWVCLACSGGYYAVMMIVLFIFEQISSSTITRGPNNPFNEYVSRLGWGDQFLHGFSFGQIWFMFIALRLGVGAIANDNRANALLVYLSKPCTKTDYIMGKWVGVFIPLLASMLVPALVFYGFGALSYRDYQFLSQDPWLILKILALMPLGAAFETSLVLGVSSLFRQGTIAGLTYAGLYFITMLFTKMIGIAYSISAWEPASPMKGPIRNLFYASIDGVQIGLAKGVFHTNGSAPFGIATPGRDGGIVPMPDLPATLGIALGIAALVIYFAWTRIKAVEVVR